MSSNLYVSDNGGNVQVAQLGLISGKQQMILGDFERDLILRTAGGLQVQVGNKFYSLDYISNGSGALISAPTTMLDLDSELATLIYPGDGQYVFVRESGAFYICSNSTYIKLNDAQTTTTPPTVVTPSTKLFLSYNAAQSLTGPQKLQVLLNSGSITSFTDLSGYATANSYPNQVTYSIEDGRHFRLVGTDPAVISSWQQLYLNLDGGNMLGGVSIALDGSVINTLSALHINGDAPAIFVKPTVPTALLTVGSVDYDNGLAIYTAIGDVYFKLLSSDYQNAFYFESISPLGVTTTPLVVSNNSISIGGAIDYNYSLSVTGDTLFLGNTTQSGNLTTTDFIKGSSGYGVSKDASNEWTLEVDHLNVRKTTIHALVFATQGLNGAQYTSYDIILTDVDFAETFPVYISAEVSGHYIDMSGTVRELSDRATYAYVKHISISDLDTTSPSQTYELIELTYAVGDNYIGAIADTTTTYNKDGDGSYYTPVGDMIYDTGSSEFIPSESGPLLQIALISVYYITTEVTLSVGDLLYYKTWNANREYISDVKAEVVSTTMDGGYYIYVYDGVMLNIGDRLVKVGNKDGTGVLLQTNAGDVYNPYIELASGITSLNDLHTNYYYEASTDYPDYDFIQNAKTLQSKTRVRLGDLSNIYDTTLGLTTQQYGLYSDNVYLKGNFVLNSAVFTTLPVVMSYENFIMLHSDNTLEQIDMGTAFTYWDQKVNPSRSIVATGSGILGGGNLSMDRSFSLDFSYLDTRYATLASPAFTGNPTATTQTTSNNSTRIATTAFVNNYAAPLNSFVTTTGDASYSPGSGWQYIICSDSITANRAVVLPLAASCVGETMYISCLNTSGIFHWSFATVIPLDQTNTSITTISNQSSYILVSDGTAWRKLN